MAGDETGIEGRGGGGGGGVMEQPYPVAPDGKLHYCDPQFDAHSFVLANGSNVDVAVSDGYATWLVKAGDTAGAGLPSGARSLQVQSVGVGSGPVTLYAREVLDAGSRLAQSVSGSISAAITNAINATVSGTVTDVPPPEAQLDSRSFATVGGKSYTVNLPANTRGVILDIGSNTHGLFHGLTIIGTQSAILYYGDNTAPLSDQFPIYMPIVVPVFSSVDSAVTIAFTYDSTTGSTWILYALTGDVPPTLGAQAAQIVRDHPAPIADQAGGSNFLAGGSGVAVLIAQTGQLPAGDYAVEADLSRRDAANASALQFGVATAAGGAGSLVGVPRQFSMIADGNHRLRWERISLAINERFLAQLAGGAGANCFYAATIRAYRIA